MTANTEMGSSQWCSHDSRSLKEETHIVVMILLRNSPSERANWFLGGPYSSNVLVNWGMLGFRVLENKYVKLVPEGGSHIVYRTINRVGIFRCATNRIKTYPDAYGTAYKFLTHDNSCTSFPLNKGWEGRGLREELRGGFSLLLYTRTHTHTRVTQILLT